MIEKRVPEDVRRFKVKTLGPLTTRQAVFSAGAAVCVIIGYFVILRPMGLSGLQDFDILFFSAAVFAAPCLCIGFFEPEKWIAPLLRYCFAPVFRVEKTSFFPPEKKHNEQKGSKKITKKELKAHPEYIPYK